MKKILVIGDSCKDVFVYCDAQRLAPDLPVPILDVHEEKENPGMAMNVFRNIKSIHSACAIATNDAWEKVTKTRYVHHKTNHTFIRIDSKHPIKPLQLSKLDLKKYDIVAISDYNKGFLTKEDIMHICKNHSCVFIDTKKPIGPWARGAKFIKINDFEYERSKETLNAGLEKKIIRTEGEKGAFYRGKQYPVSEKVEVKDTTGAGDSFYAALLVRYAETGDVEEAISFANECARRSVMTPGVSVIARPA
ncbi:MAG: Synechococcus phage [Candidatus Parcubacteria bacterium]|jgi:bifunctional ADP-heptose synthase (sugar kinase/adenylyltransferase)